MPPCMVYENQRLGAQIGLGTTSKAWQGHRDTEFMSALGAMQYVEVLRVMGPYMPCACSPVKLSTMRPQTKQWAIMWDSKSLGYWSRRHTCLLNSTAARVVMWSMPCIQLVGFRRRAQLNCSNQTQTRSLGKGGWCPH